MLGELLASTSARRSPSRWSLGTAFTIAYVAAGGFRTVVDTNTLQFVLMFVAFLVVLPVALARIGGSRRAVGRAAGQRPRRGTAASARRRGRLVLHRAADARRADLLPALLRRRTPAVARRGVLVSVAFWVLFDFLTTFSGLAARVLMPASPTRFSPTPSSADSCSRRSANALFAVGLFATVMSTAHSYLFLAAATVGHDIAPELARGARRAPLDDARPRRRRRRRDRARARAAQRDRRSGTTSAASSPRRCCCRSRSRTSRRGSASGRRWAAAAMASRLRWSTGWILARGSAAPTRSGSSRSSRRCSCPRRSGSRTSGCAARRAADSSPHPPFQPTAHRPPPK